MFETNGSDLSVDRLMHEIRRSVAKRQIDVGASESTTPSSTNGGITDPDSNFRLQPPFRVKQDNQYHLNDLVKYHGEDFVRNAYRALLGREPDGPGFSHNMECLASGRFNKVDIIASLHSSPEGQRERVKVSGLKFHSWVRRLGRLPVIGYFIQWIIAIVRLPNLFQYLRQHEFYVWAQQERVVAHSNQIWKQFREALGQVSAQLLAGTQVVTEQQQSLERLQQEQAEIETRFVSLIKATEMSAVQIDTTSRSLEDTTRALEKLLDQQQQFKDELNQVILQQQKSQVEIVMHERRVSTLLEELEPTSSKGNKASFSQLVEEEDSHVLDSLYASFEDRFRGEREEVRRRLEVYLPILKSLPVKDHVLDIGSGRGEWLDLLKSEGIKGKGVDHNRVFIDQCKKDGLDVVENDALVYLRGLPDNSLNVVTSFHLVEHLPFEQLINLLDEMIRILKPEGMVILETPNPENFMVGSYSFYADPTHRNPIPSQTLEFLLESRGFCNINVMKLRPWDAAKINGDSEIISRFNEYFYSAPDYGITARKP
jgi:SAM-dependent methyltransferase